MMPSPSDNAAENDVAAEPEPEAREEMGDAGVGTEAETGAAGSPE